MAARRTSPFGDDPGRERMTEDEPSQEAPNATTMSEVFERNRYAWDAASDAYQARHGAQLRRDPAAWGVWSLAESELTLLDDVAGCDVLEFGCGAAGWSIALARRGARVTGLDNSARQLEHAREAVAAAGVDVRLVHAPGEAMPFDAASFDRVFCDHGAMSFAQPERTIPEVARVLRPGGIFVFNVEHPLHAACWDDVADAPSRRLHRSYFALDRSEDPADGTVNFARPISAYVALLDTNGLQIERLLEPRPPEGATTSYEAFTGVRWAGDFPAELIIRARRR
jgi:SAM-dependent methyltransferase